MVLDSQGVTGWLEKDRHVMSLLHAGRVDGSDILVSAMTILEVSYRRIDPARLDWVLSQVRVEPVTRTTARAAAALMVGAGMAGHRHAIDACVAELAVRYAPSVAILTSDPVDLRRLCSDAVHIIRV